MKKMIMIVLLISANTIFAQAKLKNPISWGAPAYGGSGCISAQQQSDVDLILKSNVLDIRFNDFGLQMDGSRRIDRKNCSLRIPVQVQPGYQLVLSTLESSAFVTKNQNYTVQTNVTLGFVGGKTAQVKSSKGASLSGDLSVSQKLSGTNAVVSPCGQEAMLEMNSSISSMATATNFSVGLLDARFNRVSTQLSVRKCK